MKSKKIIIVIIAALFFAAVIFAVITVFTVNNIVVSCQAYSSTDNYSLEICEKLEKYKGYNLLFLDAQDVENLIEEYPYVDGVKVVKSFPNTLTVEINAKQEIYTFKNGDKHFVLTDDGYVLAEKEIAEENKRDYIALSFSSDIAVEDCTVGEFLKTDADSELKIAFNLLKRVDLTDCVSAVTLVDKGVDNQYDLTLSTYTEVTITLWDIDRRGEEKIDKAFEVYDTLMTDYEKSYNTILVYEVQVGEEADWTIRATWTQYP